MTIILIAAAIIISGIFLNMQFVMEKWADPDYVTSTLADNLTEFIAEQGLLYPANDLNDPLLENRKIVINTGINEQTTKEVVRKLLYLDSIDNTAPIQLYISTQGGWYDSAFTIIDTFHAIDSPVDTICVGGCYSAGAVIMAGGTGKRLALPNALFSVHWSYNEKEDDRPYSKLPSRTNAYLKKHTRLPADWFPLENDRSYYFTAVQAKEFGVVDAVLDKKNMASEKTSQTKQ